MHSFIQIYVGREVFASSIRHQFKTALLLWGPQRADLVSTAV